jgi:hypothetical protein
MPLRARLEKASAAELKVDRLEGGGGEMTEMYIHDIESEIFNKRVPT